MVQHTFIILCLFAAITLVLAVVGPDTDSRTIYILGGTTFGLSVLTTPDHWMLSAAMANWIFV